MDGFKLTWSVVVLVALLATSVNVAAWKKDEFRRCDQSAFCKDTRNREPGSSNLEVKDLKIADGVLRARLVPSDAGGGGTTEQGGGGEEEGDLVLEIKAYKNGIVRLKVTEEKHPEKRFEVPDVLVKNLEDKKLWLQRFVEKDDGSSMVHLSGHDVVLQHKPFQVHVKRGSDLVLSVNSKGLFNFEKLREKKEGENWEDRFRTYADSRPYGPQTLSFDVSFHGTEHVYGIPEHATSLALKPTKGPNISSEPYRLFNLDVFEYISESPFGLYGAVPFMLSHSVDKSAGFFLLNSAEMQIDVLASSWDTTPSIEMEGEGGSSKLLENGNKGKIVDTHWIVESGVFDAFVFVGPSPKDVVTQYCAVTGTTSLPPLFSTAYHQCRWNYKDEADVAAVDAGFDEHDIPYDVLWLDIEHTDGKRYFTWDPILFPTPKEMQAKLSAKGRHMVTIVDPHIKRDDGFPLHKEASSKGYYVKDSGGNDYDGWCWPGSSSYLDMLNPEIRSWWADKFSLSSYVGSTPILHIWNDMNEPSVFNGPEGTMPKDALHYNGVEHRDVHNAYGYYFHMASVEGLLRRGGGNERPFVLSRAFFAGTQKVGPVWTGDNTADWTHLRVSVPMCLTLGLTGIAFTGADVGGFFGNPDPELLTRWYQLGAYYPFFRGHAHLDTKRREPWVFGEPYTTLMREAVHSRYSLLPYVYTLFKEASVTGVPLMRPLWMEFPEDISTFERDEEFLLGPSLLVHGVYSQGATSETVYLPGTQKWYDVKTGATYAAGQKVNVPVTMDGIPVFQRAGSIIARKQRRRRSSTQMETDPYTLVVALNSTYEASGELYIDDGKSYDFEQGAFIHRQFKFSKGRLTSTILAPVKTGSKVFTTSCLVERIVILGVRAKDLTIGKNAIVEQDERRIETDIGPPLLQRGASSTALILRLPNVRISDNWSIKLV